MKPGTKFVGAVLFGATIAGAAFYLNAGNRGPKAYAQTLPTHPLPPAKDGGIVVQLCDGKTSTEIKGLKPGEQMTHGQAVDVSRRLMAEWQRKHPDQHWIMAQADTGGTTPSAEQPLASPSSSANIAGPGASGASQLTSQQGDTYASFHQRDYIIFQAETEAFVEQGKKVFHSAKLLSGTIGVSCDMCHPDAANTHPETYPKYQEQLQRVALLRDMINWCIENPVKGKTLDPNDPKLRALEAYILAQRKGVPLAYGKH
jgi:thiosulfate dehydrogenase